MKKNILILAVLNSTVAFSSQADSNILVANCTSSRYTDQTASLTLDTSNPKAKFGFDFTGKWNSPHDYKFTSNNYCVGPAASGLPAFLVKGTVNLPGHKNPVPVQLEFKFAVGILESRVAYTIQESPERGPEEIYPLHCSIAPDPLSSYDSLNPQNAFHIAIRKLIMQFPYPQCI